MELTAKARALVEKGTATLTAPPKRIPSDLVVDAPLLGNGDLGAAIAGDGARQIYHLGKNDFWAQAHLGETWEQRAKRLITKEGRRSGTRIVTAGWMEIEIPQLAGCSYQAVQDPYLAEVRAEYRNGDACAAYTSLICAEQNTLIVEVQNSGSAALDISFRTMAGPFGSDEVYAYADGIREDTVWVEYTADIHDLPGRRWVFTGVTCDREARYTPDMMVRKGAAFALPPGEAVRICLTMLSDLDGDPSLPYAERAAAAKEDAHRLCVLSRTDWQNLRARHRQWWESFWLRSLVETGSDELDSFYYASYYILASSVREGKVPPGLFGPWVTTDKPKWTGSYTLNYNYESPFFPLYTGNHGELAASYIEPLLDIIPVGRLYAKEKFGRPGVCLPVELGPWGTVCSSIFHHQKTNAAYCCCNIFMHFFSTLDMDWGRRAYPFVREVADFWEADLVWEEDRRRYSVIGDSLHEVYYREDGEKNNCHALGLIRMVMRGILRMSAQLDLDEDRREKWRHIEENLAAFPTFERNGQTVFRFNEDNYAWLDRSNGTSIKLIYPFNCVGLDSDPALLETALNTVCQRDHLFDNGNAFCEYTVMCARVGRDPQLLYDKLIEQSNLRSMPNKYIWHGGGGIEDCAGVTSGINEMMLQSHEDVVRVFPVWPKDTDASFYRLRAWGAFLVSASIADNRIESIIIESEKGRSLTIELPWERAMLRVNGQQRGELPAGRVTIPTRPGDRLEFLGA